MMSKRLPLVFFVVIIFLLWRGLHLHPTEVPSPLINQAAPSLHLPDLLQKKTWVTNQDLLGRVTLVNVWASWCTACADEHETLLQLAHETHLFIIGFDYKDDEASAKKWLAENGNPYQKVAVDADGLAALDWGIYGTPETFLLDKHGVIRFKQIGPMTLALWQTTLQPLVEKLQRESI